MVLLLILLSMLAAVVPMLCFLVLIWWLDRYDREPWWMMALAFGWGAGGGVLVAVIGSTLVSVPLQIGLTAELAGAVSTVAVAPLVEEPSKALILLILLTSRHWDNTTDGFVYGAAAGLGFGMTENFLYFVDTAEAGDVGAWLGLVFIRTFWSALMHAAATSVVGAALGFARHRGCLTMALAATLGLGLAMAIHALWNGLMVAGQGENGALVGLNLLLFPLEFFTLFVVLQICLYDESRTIRRELALEAQRGLLPAEHVEILASTWRRARRSWLPPKVNHHAYVRACTRLAFRRHAASRARDRAGLEREITALREEIQAALRA